MMSMLTRSAYCTGGVALCALLGVACTDVAGVSQGQHTPQQPGTSSSVLAVGGVAVSEVSAGVRVSLSEHRDPAKIAQGLEVGTLEFRQDEPFVAAYVMMATTGFVAMQMAYERVDGSWSEFAQVEVDENVIDGARLRLVLPEAARAIRLYASKGAQDVTFVTTRHYSQIPSAFGAHMDIPGSVNASLTGLGFLEERLTLAQGLAQEGAYVVTPTVEARGNAQDVPYEEATLREADMEGTRRLARYLKEKYPQIILVEGHYVRENTAGGGLSVHSAGRALDLFIRRDLSKTHPYQADNDLGDPVANWLIANAESVGVTFLIWDRTKWSASKNYPETNKRHAPYDREKTHPHDDHIHVEISTAAGDLQTDFFESPTTATTDEAGVAEVTPLDPTGLSCISRHKAGGTMQGDCVQGESSWGDCTWYRCDEWGVFSAVDVSTCTQSTFAKRELWCVDDATQREDGCYSQQLEQTVEVGDCIQTEETQIHCGACSWMVCSEKGMQCIRDTRATSCTKTDHASAVCEEEPTEPVQPVRANQLVMTLEWSSSVDLDIVVQEPSLQSVAYSNSAPTMNDGEVGGCNPLINACGRTSPYREVAYWGENSMIVVPGIYTVYVRNYSSSEGSAYTVKVERFDAQGMATTLQEFSGNVTARYSTSGPYEVTAGTVTVQ